MINYLGGEAINLHAFSLGTVPTSKLRFVCNTALARKRQRRVLTNAVRKDLSHNIRISRDRSFVALLLRTRPWRESATA